MIIAVPNLKLFVNCLTCIYYSAELTLRQLILAKLLFKILQNWNPLSP